MLQLLKGLSYETQEHRLIKIPIAPAIAEKVQLVLKKFGDKQFLSAVKNCYTINTNRKFHHVLWSD